MRSLSILTLFLAACCRSGTPQPAVPSDGADETATTGETGTGDPVSADETGPGDSPTRVRVGAEEAAEHGLTPFGFSIDTAGTPMSTLVFPDEGEYLAVSGPPGGPQMIRFVSLPERVEAGALEPILRARFSHVGDDPFVAGTPTEVTLSGSPRAALPFTTGQSMARTGWCAVLVDSRLRGDAPQLLVLVGLGSPGEPDCDPPLADPHLARILASLHEE